MAKYPFEHATPCKTTSILELAKMVDTTITIKVESFIIPVKVLDVKISYGIPRLSVRPTEGVGQAWIELSRIVEG